jgi:hypothetical protein
MSPRQDFRLRVRTQFLISNYNAIENAESDHFIESMHGNERIHPSLKGTV